MSINPLNDISKIYLESVSKSSYLETDMKKRQSENEKAIADMKKTAAYKSMAAAAAKKFDEGLDPVGKEDSDVDNDGKKNTKSDKYLLNRRKQINKAIETQEEAKRWWDDDGDGKGWEKGEVSGKFKKNKKVTKEGFSNWRQDLSEVMTDTEFGKKIKEKKIKNKIKINPSISETVENLGGTLIEMVEIDEVEFVVESVYDELLEEGYDEDDIEEAIEYALTEATVTYGHDTDKPHQKKSGAGHLVKAVGRLARQKLASKVSGAKKAAAGAVAKGARKVAKGALGVARKMEGGDKKPSTAHTKTRTASTYRGAGVGQKEKVSSGSYTGPAKKKAEPVADPWEGSAVTPTKAKAKTKKAAAPKAKAPAAAAPKRKRKSKLDSLLADIRSEQVHIDEKTLTAAETKEKERIVKSMKDKAADFEKRYPGRGKEVMYATATKMAKKMAEQAMELQPKTQQTGSPQQDAKTRSAAQKAKQTAISIKQKELQALRSTPAGTPVSGFGG
jgi:hypothetical protein